MEIDVTLHPDGSEPIAIMRLKGEINASNFILVSDKAQELYMNPARKLIIDLSEVPGISSTGLAAIHKIALVYSGVPTESTGECQSRFHAQQQCAQARQASQPAAGCGQNARERRAEAFLQGVQRP
jgi:hypothetical protein